jgi:2-keto-4-pentenoate hydratase/2-oxohepta-3-ene-1,7-dioic acid hydratase in catechol pathway
MRFARFASETNAPIYGWIDGGKIGAVQGSIFGEFLRLEAELPLVNIRLLPPVEPSKIVCVGRNYIEHAKEQNAEVPEIPILFLKPPSAIIGTGDTILLPAQSQRIEHEAELVVVIGKRCRNLMPEEALDYVFGYTIGNDVTARDLQRMDGQWTRGKSFDTFCPVGPWIETNLNIQDVLITCRVNGEVRQMASTQTMVFTVAQLISFISSVMTLEAGDIILTGTPAGVGMLVDGDQVEVTIEGIGTLINKVARG